MVVDEIQDFLEPYRMWLVGLFVILGIATAVVPQLAVITSLVNPILGLVLAIYLLAWGASEGFDFGLQGTAYISLIGFALITAGASALTGFFSNFNLLAGLGSGIGSALGLPLAIVGGGFLLLGLFGAVKEAA